MAYMRLEDYFAEAADRLQDGVPIERIVDGYPADVRAELQALLVVVELAEQVAAIAPPQRLPLNRVAARVNFSQRAAELRAEFEAGRRTLDAPIVTPAPQQHAYPHPVRRQERLLVWWRQLKASWVLPTSAPAMRFAPLPLLLAIIYLLTFTVVATAQEALPGDPVYPMRLWILEQRVATTPGEHRAEERQLADREQAEDVARLAEQLQSTPDAAPVTTISIQQFRGFDGDHLLVGDLKVIPWYQWEGAGPDEWLPISIEGELEPGAVVMLRYQIIPGAPNAVRGIALRVMQAPSLSTPLPSPTPTPGVHCQRTQAPNWVEYIVKAGESLNDIAVRSLTSVTELRRVNCLTDGDVRAGMTIFAPVNVLGRVPAAPPPAVVTAIPTQMIAPTATSAPIVPTDTPAPPTSAATITPTPDTPPTEPTSVQPGGGEGTSPTVAPTETVAPDETAAPSETAAPTNTISSTGTAVPVDPSATATPAVDATPAATDLPATQTLTPDQTKPPATATEAAITPNPGGQTPSVSPTTTATSAATATTAATPTPASASTPTLTPDSAPTAALEASPTTAPTSIESAGSAGATSTAMPTSTTAPATATPAPMATSTPVSLPDGGGD